MTTLTDEELNNLIEKITEDPNLIGTLSDEQISQISGHVSVFGIPKTPDDAKTYANLSIVNWRKTYLEQLILTALVGYLHRTAYEFEPEEELEKIRKTYTDLLATNLTPDSAEAIRKERDEKCKAVVSAARSVINRFLARNFEYNPDYHLRAATTSPEERDPERIFAKAKLDEIRDATPQSYGKKTPDINLALSAFQAAASALSAVQKCAEVAKDQDSRNILRKNADELSAMLSRLAPDVRREKKNLLSEIKPPPAEVFHHFHRYFDNHYETLQQYVCAYYSTKPDIEFAIKLFGAFDSPEAAKEHREKNNKNFTHDVITVESNCITLLGPFKENRSRIEYYNQQNEILKDLEDFAKKDAELGKDLLKKTVQRKKAQNVREQGPEAAGLSKFMKVASDAQSKSTRILTKEENEKLAELQTKIEDAAVPEGAIQMNVYQTEYSVDGEARLTRGKLYTKAETPEQYGESGKKKKKRR